MSDAKAMSAADLSAAKKALLAKRLKGKVSSGAVPAVAISKRTSEGPVPLSLEQEGLWFLEQVSPGSGEYNMPFAFKTAAPLDTSCLQTAVSALESRHRILSSHVVVQDNVPLLECSPSCAVTVSEQASTDLDADLMALSEAPFDLLAGPLWRICVLHTCDGDVLCFVFHHSVFDGASFPVLLSDLSELMAASGEARALPGLPVDYEDYCVWQRSELDGDALQGHRDFWRQRLSGELPLLQLPVDFPRPPVRSVEGATVECQVPEALLERLDALARETKSTSFMSLLTVFQVFLCRYTGVGDVIVGSPVSKRQHRELESLVGFFVNTIPFRGVFDSATSLRQALAQGRDSAMEAISYQDLPFQQIVEAVNPDRDPSRTPLFQALFTYEDHRDAELSFGGAPVEPVHLDTDAALTDVLLEVHRRDGDTTLRLIYGKTLFSAFSATQMLDHFVVCLKAFVETPEKTLGQFDLLTAADCERLSDWQGTASPYPRDSSVVALFEAQASERGDHVAIVSPGGQGDVSYQVLDDMANRVRGYLGSIDVQPGDMVGICCERSAELLAAILGILKTGAAFVPLDPSYPSDRLALMMSDSEMKVLIADKRSAAKLPAFSGTRVALVDCFDGDAAPGTRTPLQPIAIDARDAAYVMYTSGSTGTPKGAVVTHRNIVRLVRDTNYLSLSSATRMLHFAPISFDASTLEVWGPLLNGGTIVLCADARPSMRDLGDLITEQHVNTMWLTAGLFRMMVDEAIESLGGVRFLLAGGDVLPTAQVERVLSELPDCQLINGYGPTENTTFTCCHVIPRDGWLGASVPIGVPVANTSVYILDEQHQRVPPGVCGELFAGGDGVARGYLKRAELTLERFLPDPFSSEPDATMYRTGDKVRFREDGCIEFLGRMDRQVKVRGFRVEPGEIEVALTELPDLVQSVVIAIQRRAGDQRLAAFYTTHEGVSLTVTDLRKHLRSRIPDYMVPQHFVEMDEIPMTDTGKIDRNALPDPVVEAGAASTYVAPATPVEERVADIVAAVLDIEKVSMDRNFFELGGHSLLALKVVANLQESLGASLSPNVILFNTIGQIAARCETEPAAEAGETVTASDVEKTSRLGRFVNKMRGKS